MRYLVDNTEEWKVFKQRKTKLRELGVWGFVKYLFWNLDIIGSIFFVVGIGCILIPLTVAGGTRANGNREILLLQLSLISLSSVFFFFGGSQVCFNEG